MKIDNQRLWDLLRHQRHDLFNDELITPGEFAELVSMKGSVQRLETYDALRGDVTRLKQHVQDLQQGMWVNCVYCGHRYGPQEDTPVALADLLKEHVEKCPEHPMSKLRDQARRDVEALFGMLAGDRVDSVVVEEIRGRWR